MPDMLPKEQIYRYLDTKGDGSGITSAIGDYSSTPTEFYITRPERSIRLQRMIVSIRDVGVFPQEGYGAMTQLVNGIYVRVKDKSDSTILSLTGQIPVKSSLDWGALCYDVTGPPLGPGDGFLTVRWTFGKGGSGIVLAPGDRLAVDLNDDFRDLIDHKFFVHGTFTPGG